MISRCLFGWKVLELLLLLCNLSPLTQSQAVSTTCEPNQQVEQDLRRLYIGGGMPVEKTLKARKKILKELIQQYPDDLFVHMEWRNQVFTTADLVAVSDQYRSLFQQHPDSLQYKYLYARALVDIDTPRAVKLLEEIVATDPAYPWPYVELAGIYSRGKYLNAAELRLDLEKFFKACPSSLDWSAWSLLQQHSSGPMAARHAHALRSRLMTERDRYRLRYYWKVVWNLEFQAAPVAEHPRLRKQIRDDLARLEQTPGEDDAHWRAFLKAGYELAEHPETVRSIEQELLAKYPDSQEAKTILSERWYKEHPWPRLEGEDKDRGFYQALLQYEDALLKSSPDDSWNLFYRFIALSKLSEATDSQLTMAADKLLGALPNDPIWQEFPPVYFQIAQSFMDRKISVERVPALIKDGFRLVHETESRSDRDTDETNTYRIEADVRLKTQAAVLLAAAAKELREPDVARAAVAELDKLNPDKPEDRSAIWAAKAIFAEAEARKLDALLMYQAARKSRPADFKAGKEDELAQNEERLWKELGGSPASRDLWEKKTIVTEIATGGQWQTPTREMQDWELSDLRGHTLKLASLAGKTVLIGLWASWCGPCREELPEFQKVYEQMTGRPDVAVVSFNVDQDVGKVEPYVRQNGYTFPVLPAHRYVGDLLGEFGVPQIWIVDPKGKWLWQQFGFDPDASKWRNGVLEKVTSARVPPTGTTDFFCRFQLIAGY